MPSLVKVFPLEIKPWGEAIAIKLWLNFLVKITILAIHGGRINPLGAPPSLYQLTGIIQLARSPYLDTWRAPRIVRSIWPLEKRKVPVR
jgi:hypothetical protein